MTPRSFASWFRHRNEHVCAYAASLELSCHDGDQHLMAHLARPVGADRSMVSKLVVTLMMRPQPCRRSGSAAARDMRNGPLRLVAIVRSQGSGSRSKTPPPAPD